MTRTKKPAPKQRLNLNAVPSTSTELKQWLQSVLLAFYPYEVVEILATIARDVAPTVADINSAAWWHKVAHSCDATAKRIRNAHVLMPLPARPAAKRQARKGKAK